MLTIIESEQSAWMVIATEGELRIYSRESAGEWTELSLEDSDEVDRDKSLMLEELYGQQARQGDDEEEEPEDEEEDEEDEEEDEPEEEEDEPEEEEDEPQRDRTASRARRGRSSRRG